MKILNDEETWKEIANELAEISGGADCKYDELHGIEKAFIAQQTDRILTIIAIKVFPKYLERMKRDLTAPPLTNT